MNFTTILVKLKKFKALRDAKKLTPLPTGVSTFNAWADSFYDLYQMPTEDRNSVKFALAAMIMHLGPQDAYKSKHYFYLSLLAGASKQVAGSVFTEIKENQRKAQIAAELEAQNVPTIQ